MEADLVDDLTIPNDAVLLRRVPRQPNAFIVWDDNLRAWTISSQAFKNHNTDPIRLSVHLKPVLDELGLPVESVLQDPEKFALAGLAAGVFRQHGQVINRVPEKSDPAHAHVVGAKPKPVMKALARAAQWVIAPPSP